MLQRIQTIWLLLASVILLAMFFFPLASTNTTGLLLPTLYTHGYASSWDTGEFISISITPIYPLIISHIALTIICAINIFNYKKRASQKRFATISIILIVGFTFLCSVYIKKLPGGINGASFGIATYLPFLAIIFLIFAILGINKDEKLIRSAETLR